MDAETLATCVREGVNALVAERWDDAIRMLGGAATSTELADAADMQDVRARVCSMLAQAYLGKDQTEPALRWCRNALRLTRSLGDEAGRKDVLQLQRRILERQLEERQAQATREETDRLARTSLEALLADMPDPVERRRLTLAKANAEIDVGRPESGVPLAAAIRDEADAIGEVRSQVVARLALCRALDAPQAGPLLLEAWGIAAAADEFNLVGAVARAAVATGITLDTLEGAWTSS